MSKVQKAVTAFEKATGIKNGNRDFLKGIEQKQRKKLAEIDEDPLLSEHGKYEKKKEVKQADSESILKQLHKRRQDYDKAIKEASKEAHDVFHHSVKAPDDKRVKEFKSELNQLKTELMLSTREEKAKEKLDAFISNLDDPFLAQRASESFGELSGHILGVAENPRRTKMELQQKYDEIRNSNLTEDQKIARDVLEQTKAAEANENFYTNPMVEADPQMPSVAKDLKEVMDDTSKNYLDKTYEYFPEEKEEEKKTTTSTNDDLRYADLIKRAEELQKKIRGDYKETEKKI